MKKILLISLMLLSIIAISSCGNKDEAPVTSGNTFSLKGSGS